MKFRALRIMPCESFGFFKKIYAAVAYSVVDDFGATSLRLPNTVLRYRCACGAKDRDRCRDSAKK